MRSESLRSKQITDLSRDINQIKALNYRPQVNNLWSEKKIRYALVNYFFYFQKITLKQKNSVIFSDNDDVYSHTKFCKLFRTKF